MSLLLWTKRAIILTLLPLLALLGACSALRLAYSTAPDLAYWYGDRYFDFSAEQAPKVRAALSEFFVWHRATQVPDYVAFLTQLRQQVGGSLTATQACQLSQDIERRLDAALDRALPSLSEVALTLTPNNLAQLERRYRSGNEDFRNEYAHADPVQRRAKSFDRSLKRLEDWYGRLDDAQRKELAEQLAASPFDAKAWLAEREAFQQDVLRTLRQQVANGAAAASADTRPMQEALRQLALRQIQSPRPTYRAYQERLRTYNCALLARMHNATSTAQRQHLQQRLKGYEEDLRRIGGMAPVDG